MSVSIDYLNDLDTEDNSPYIFLPNGQLISTVSGANKQFIKQTVDMTPMSSNSGVFTNDQAQLTWQITPGLDVDVAEKMYLRLLISNSDPTNDIEIVPPQFLIQRIEWYFNNQLASTQYGTPGQLWADWLIYRKFTTLNKEAYAQGVNPSTFTTTPAGPQLTGAASTLIPHAGSMQFFIPVMCPFTHIDMPMGLIQDKVNIRAQIYFNAGDNYLDTASAGHLSSLVLTSSSLRILGANYMKQEDRDRHMKNLISHTHVYRYLYESLFPITATGISNNGSTAPYQVTMNITGRMAALAVLAQLQTQSAAGLYAPQYLASYQYLDGSGNSILGWNSQVEDIFSRFCYNSAEVDSLALNNVAIYLAAFSANILVTYNSGTMLGEVEINNSYRFQYLPALGTSGANWILNILAWQYAALVIDGPTGRVTIIR